MNLISAVWNPDDWAILKEMIPSEADFARKVKTDSIGAPGRGPLGITFIGSK